MVEELSGQELVLVYVLNCLFPVQRFPFGEFHHLVIAQIKLLEICSDNKELKALIKNFVSQKLSKYKIKHTPKRNILKTQNTSQNQNAG